MRHGRWRGREGEREAERRTNPGCILPNVIDL